MVRARLVADALVIAWAVAWMATGVVIAREVRDLARLSDTVVELGQATRDAGAVIGTLDSLPLVGERLGPPAASIREAGEDAIRSGRASRQSADRLAILLGVSVALIPSVGMLAIRIHARTHR